MSEGGDEQPELAPRPTEVVEKQVDDAGAGAGWWSNLSLRSKLLLMLLATSLINAGTIAWISYSSGQRALTSQTMENLTGKRSAKQMQVEWYFRNMRQTFRTFGEDVAVGAALAMFRDGYNQSAKQALPPERRAKLQDYYTQDYLAKLAPALTSTPVLENFWPRQEKTLELQSLFITENPNPAGSREKLTDHPVHNAYTLAHNTYHKWFREFSERLSFYDVFLIDGETGQIVYSVEKEPDFGTNLKDGPYATTNLGRLYKKIVDGRQPGLVHISDFEFYAPSFNQPAMFIATPIYADWKFLGVLAAQVSPDALNNFVSNNQHWIEEGLRKTGEVIIIGDDRKMRTNSRFLVEDQAAFLAHLVKQDRPAEEIETIKRNGTTILGLNATSSLYSDTVSGATGTSRGIDYRGSDVLAAYAPLAIEDVRWFLQTEIDVDEALAPQSELNRQILIAACLLTLATTLASLWLASKFLWPLRSLLGGIEKIRSGERNVQIEAAGRDEFGTLGRAFNSMASTIHDRDTVIGTKTRAYEQLLRNIFPDVVADRMKKGEGQIADTFPQVSVVFASIHGFITETEAHADTNPLDLLNQIVDSFDAIADELGVEKIKTIGEHYLAGCGLSVARLDHAKRAVEFADRCAAELGRINQLHGLKLGLRIGIATGPVHAGLVGNRRFVYDIWGRAPNVARRIVHETDINEVRLAEETFQILQEPAEFSDVQIVKSRTLGDLKTYGRELRLSIAAPEANGRGRPPAPLASAGKGDHPLRG